MDIGQGGDVHDEELEVDIHNKDRWAQALVNKVTAVTAAFRGAGDQRHAARRTYLQLAPEARTESYLEVIDEVLYQTSALSRLTRNARMAVARRAHVLEFQPGEALCLKGTPQEVLLVVMSGEVEVVDGHWDGSAAPPPLAPENNRFGRHSLEALTPRPPPPPPPPQPPLLPQPPPPLPPQLAQQPSQGFPISQYPSRRHLMEQLSVSSSTNGQGSVVVAAAAAAAAAVGASSLQLDSRHAIHPALQSHPSATHRRYNHHYRPHSRASTRSAASRGSTVLGADGGGGGGVRSRRVMILHRGDSLGAVDMGWLSRLPRSVTAAALDEVPASPSITTRALLATRAEMASGGSFSGGQVSGPGGVGSSSGGGGGGGGGSGHRRSSCAGIAGEVDGIGRGTVDGCGEQAGEWPEGRGASRGGGGGGSGGGGDGGGNDPLQRLRWPCTAVAMGGRVECVAIGLQQLCAVLGTESHWDVEALVESLEELPVFAALSGAELRQLVRVLRLHTFSGGTVVYKQGSVGNDLYIIRSGCVRLLKQVALDDKARNRLNRISAELSAVRDQTATAAALLHGVPSVAPFGSSSGYHPAAGPGGPLGRVSTPASTSGSSPATSAPVSPGRVRRLSQGAGGGGRFGYGTPGSPRGELLHTSVSATAAIQTLMGRGSLHNTTSAPVPTAVPTNIRDRTPQRPGKTTNASSTNPSSSNGNGNGSLTQPLSYTQQQLQQLLLSSPPGSRPVTSDVGGPMAAAAVAAGGGVLPSRWLPVAGTNGRAQSGGSAAAAAAPGGGGSKDPSRSVSSSSSSTDVTWRRHSAAAQPGGVPGSPVGGYQMYQQPPQQQQYGAAGSVPQTPARDQLSGSNQHSPPLPPPEGQGGGQRQNRHRRRSSHAAAADPLDRFGVVPRMLGERTEAMYEDVIMPGALGAPSTLAAAAAVHDRGEVQYGTSDSDNGGAAPNSPPGLPPVAGSRSPSISQIPGGWASAAAAAAGGGGGGGGSPPTAGSASLPVWQARVPRQLSTGPELVFVELGLLTAGQCFGEVRSDGVALRTSSAVCDTRTEVLTISRNELHQRLGGRVFDYLWNQIPSDGAPGSHDPAKEAGQCAQQLERSMQWTLFKQKLVADVLQQKEERRRVALKCR